MSTVTTVETEREKPTPELIVQAARVLASACDGAQALDGIGYNGVDAGFMRKLAALEVHTPRQLRAMWNCLRKYRTQLGGNGIEYDAMVPPNLPARSAAGTFLPSAKVEWVETKYGRSIAVMFAYDEGLVASIKALKKSPKSPPWFDGERRCWVLPEDNLDLLADVLAIFEGRGNFQITVAPDLGKHIQQARDSRRRSYEESRAATAELDVPTKLPLYPFQRAGVKWGLEHNGRILIADEMGLGKTAEVLGFWAIRTDALPALVICPATLRVNWYKEIQKFTDFKAQVICSKTGLKSMKKLGVNAALSPEPGYDIYIVNYDLLSAATPATWVRDLKRGDRKASGLLLEGGHYSMSALQKGLKGATVENKAKLHRVMKEIGEQKKPNRRRFIKVAVNGTPLEQFLEVGFKSLACDESHACKDGKAQRTMAAVEIAKRMKHAICMTGTPLLNRPRELWTQTQIVDPNLFPSFMTYAKEYCAAVQTRYGWDFSGASNLEKLDRELRSTIMIRRTKAQVLPELPPKTRITIPIALNGKLDKYKKEAATFFENLAELSAKREEWKAKMAAMDDEKRAKYLAEHAAEVSAAAGLTGHMISEIEAVKQAALNAKFDDCVKFAIDAQEQQGKLLIFATHHDTIDRTVAAFEKIGLKVDNIDGRVTTHKREEIKERFQNGDLDVLVGGIRAMAEGLTLTASHTVIFFEFDWNPGKHQQAEDRVHRISQTVAPTMYYLVGIGTIEERIVEMIDAKLEVVNSAIGEGDRTLDEGGILDAILIEVTNV